MNKTLFQAKLRFSTAACLQTAKIYGSLVFIQMLIQISKASNCRKAGEIYHDFYNTLALDRCKRGGCSPFSSIDEIFVAVSYTLQTFAHKGQSFVSFSVLTSVNLNFSTNRAVH